MNFVSGFKKEDHEYKDKIAFLDLMKCCLHPNSNHRITSSEALKHSVVTTDNLHLS